MRGGGRTKSQEPRTRNQERGTKNEEPRTRNQEQLFALELVGLDEGFLMKDEG